MNAKLALIFLALLASTSFASEWTSYSNARFGVNIDVPPAFVNDVPASANGDGLTFHSADGQTELLVWGNNLVDEDFREDSTGRLNSDTQDGWVIAYQAGVNSDDWQVYSGTRNGRLLYVKSISSCKNTQALHFRIEYPEAQKTAYDAVVARLSRSLKAGPATDCP
jgi:hypothetical protein